LPGFAVIMLMLRLVMYKAGAPADFNIGERMSANLSIRWRYAAYGTATVLAAAAYLWLGQDNYSPPESAGRPFAAEELPTLRFLDYGIQAEEHRDLFAFAKSGQNSEPALPLPGTAPPPRIEIAPQAPDLLADLKVIGLVRRAGEVLILLQVGTKLRTVAPGERFGASDALIVTSIQGRNVVVVDDIAKTSKIYALNEE